jgi:hypothetical protein
MMRNGLNDLVTAHLIFKLLGILYFFVMKSPVVLAMAAKLEESLTSQK